MRELLPRTKKDVRNNFFWFIDTNDLIYFKYDRLTRLFGIKNEYNLKVLSKPIMVGDAYIYDTKIVENRITWFGITLFKIKSR
jgi:hypothetical protein